MSFLPTVIRADSLTVGNNSIERFYMNYILLFKFWSCLGSDESKKKVYTQILYIHALYNTMHVHFVHLFNFIPEEQGAIKTN